MQIKTEGIVLHALRYSEADLIVKIVTQQEGIVSYLVSGVLKSKKGKFKASFFQNLSILDMDATHKPKATLKRLNEVKPQLHFQSIHTNIVKGAIGVFIAEILQQVLIDSQPDDDLYLFLKKAVLWLDSNNDIQLFHVLFLLKLTHFLGFYPDHSNVELPQFNLLDGNFDVGSKSHYMISGKVLDNFRLLLGTNFDKVSTVMLAKSERMHLLEVLLLYYELHITGFKKPKSLTVLQEIFS